MASRACRIWITDIHGNTHSVSVHASTLFEAAAAGLAAFRQEGWAADALTANAVLRVEVQLPPVTHDVPVKAVERWLKSPNVSPREYVVKRRLRDT